MIALAALLVLAAHAGTAEDVQLRAREHGCVTSPEHLAGSEMYKCTNASGNTAYFNVAGAGKPTAKLGVGPSSILIRCLDPGPTTLGVGPSARARECTRQHCALPEFKAKVSAFAFGKKQSPADQDDARACVTRAEIERAAR